jgi:hypothetical protein
MITDKEYLGSGAISQSRLKKILVHPSQYIDPREDSEFDEPKTNIAIGDGVDILLTQDEDAFFEQFHIASVERPTGQMGDYVWSLFVHRNNDNAEEIAYQEAGFRRDTFEKVKQRFETEGAPYFNDLLAGEGKTVITPQQFTQIQTAKETLLTHPFTSKYFQNTERYEVHYQYPIYFNYEGYECKGLLDMLIVDKEERAVFPIDIKTTNYKVDSWVGNFWSLRYDFQAAFYSYGLLLSDTLHKFNCDKIGTFRFLVVNQTNPSTPLVFEAGPDIIKFGHTGGKIISREYEGFSQAIKRLAWHTENDLWEYRMEDYLNKGVRQINLATV